MSPPTPVLGLAACRKLGYPTVPAVLEALVTAAAEERRQGRRPERARYYYCTSCDAYHIGMSHRRWPRRRKPHAAEPAP
jgi:hypothetical protein